MILFPKRKKKDSTPTLNFLHICTEEIIKLLMKMWYQLMDGILVDHKKSYKWKKLIKKHACLRK